ncbi:MAG: inorganic diphosphatase, partial [Alphaproteobacteria bacterium]
EESDVKLIGVYSTDPRYEEYEDIKDIRKHKIKEIINFFESYKVLQGKTVEIEKIEDRAAALKAIEKSIRLFNEGKK